MNTDTDSLTVSLTDIKTNQSSKNDSNQLYIKHVKNDDINNRFIIYHQNISGLRSKIHEFMLSLPPEAPRLICFTEHYLKDYELNNIHIPKYKLGAKYCTKNLKQGGVCICTHETVNYININLLKYSKKQDLEIAAIQLNIQEVKIIILCIYRVPNGNFDCFLNKQEIILNFLHKHNAEFIRCGDININYLKFHNKKNHLDNLLGTYNLTDIVFYHKNSQQFSHTNW